MKRAVHLHKLPKDFQMESLSENITQRKKQGHHQKSVENFDGSSDDKFFEKCFAIDFQLEKLNENGANACTKGIFENGCVSTKTYAIIFS